MLSTGCEQGAWYAGSVSDRVRSVRGLLEAARGENARMVAAAIGAHLSAFAAVPDAAPSLNAIVARLRETSFGLVTALHRGGEAAMEREEALRALDALDFAARMTKPAAAAAPATRRFSLAGWGLLFGRERRVPLAPG